MFFFVACCHGNKIADYINSFYWIATLFIYFGTDLQCIFYSAIHKKLASINKWFSTLLYSCFFALFNLLHFSFITSRVSILFFFCHFSLPLPFYHLLVNFLSVVFSSCLSFSFQFGIIFLLLYLSFSIVFLFSVGYFFFFYFFHILLFTNLSLVKQKKKQMDFAATHFKMKKECLP